MIARLLALTLALAASPVAAAQCGTREDVVAQLSAKYGEYPRSMGLSADNSAIVEVFASDSGTWTITVTTPEGVTCLVASGGSFRASPQGVAG